MTDRENPVFRPPFTLRLQVDDQHYYEQHFDRIPYAAENEVYLFAGEAFGINVAIVRDQIAAVSYQKDPARADVGPCVYARKVAARPDHVAGHPQ